ncbi:HNH endonuclease [Pseudomonas syringae]|nr:HNH endonuclease [Pseudomonas syringae]
MDGQLMGRTDKLITEHSERGLELLVFYRKKKNEHPDYGFIFEGRFLHHSHEGAGPTKFILHRERIKLPTIASVEAELATQEIFDPSDLIDARKRILATIVRRQGQGAFRKKILNAYSARCAVTGCAIEALLEAAHIVPYLGAETNVVSNGLLLRADIHTLFDLGLLWIEPETMQVGLSAQLKASEYQSLENTPMQLPDRLIDQPSLEAVRAHWQMRKAL